MSKKKAIVLDSNNQPQALQSGDTVDVGILIQQIATATGSADAITATFTEPLTLSDKMICVVQAISTNVTTTPTFAPDGLTAHTIVQGGGQALRAGDIQALSVLILEYNLANTRWELLNPNKVSLTSDVVGTLPILNGGSGSTIALTGSVVMTGGNVSTTSTGASDVTGMILPLLASSRYIITIWAKIGCNNTGGMKLACTTPSGAVYQFAYFGDTTAATAFGRPSTINVDDAFATQALVSENTIGGFALIKCDITTTNAGNFQLRFASTTNGQTSIFYQVGSHLDWRKVS